MGFPRADVVDTDFLFLRPREEGFRGNFRTIIGDEDLRFSSRLDEPIEYISDHLRRDQGIYTDLQALLCINVKDREAPKAPPSGSCIMDKVKSPLVIFPGRNRQRNP